MSMGSLGFNQGRSDEGWRPLTLPLILSPSIWALVNNHQWVGPGDRSLALRKINISSLLKAASHLAQARKFHPRLSMMSQYQSEEKPHWAGGDPDDTQRKFIREPSENVIPLRGRGRGGTGPLENKRLTDGGSVGLGDDGASRPPPATPNVTHWANWRDNTGEDEEGWGDAGTQICNPTSAHNRCCAVSLSDVLGMCTTNLNCSRVRVKMEGFSEHVLCFLFGTNGANG